VLSAARHIEKDTKTPGVLEEVEIQEGEILKWKY